MMVSEQDETTHNYLENTTICLQSKAYPYGLQFNGNYLGFLETKDALGSYAGGVTMETNCSVNYNQWPFPFEAYYMTTLQPSHHIYSAILPDIQNAQQNHVHELESHFSTTNLEGFSVDNQFCYMPSNTSSQSYPSYFQFQEFQYFIVLDFEATCDKERNPHPQEIIEFPCVLVNSATGQIEGCFQRYVRPTHNNLLSDFCKELTGIQQTQVDKGVLLSDALRMHDEWLEAKGIKQTNFAVVTWSNWDCKVMLESECRFKKIQKPSYFNRWINLRVPFNEVFGKVKCNLKQAVQHAGLEWEGRAHCGLDDAKNTAHLLVNIMYRGFQFNITNSLNQQLVERPSTTTTTTNTIQQTIQRSTEPNLSIQLQNLQVGDTQIDDGRMICYCGAKTCRIMIRKPGPSHGQYFFGCGNWTTTRGALCSYFQWAD